MCVSVCERESEWLSMCHSGEIDLLSLYFKLPCHTPPFATSEGCLFVDIKRFSVSFVIQIIIPITVAFDVYVAVLCFVYVCVCLYSIWSIVHVCVCVCMNIISGICLCMYWIHVWNIDIYKDHRINEFLQEVLKDETGPFKDAIYTKLLVLYSKPVHICLCLAKTSFLVSCLATATEIRLSLHSDLG